MARAIYAQQQIVGLALATSANGTARNGADLATAEAAGGSITFKCESRITTLNVICTWKIQVSDDASTYYDVKLPNNAANVATAAGTGSEVITYLALCPGDLSGWRYVRCVATLSGAATAAADKTQVDYKIRRFGQP